MEIAVKLLLWVHLLALAMGLGGGIGLSQVAPRLIAAAPDERGAWWPMVKVFSRIANIGLVLLVITGPILLRLKFGGGGQGQNLWFVLKMCLVVVAVGLVGFTSWGATLLERGDEGGGKLMSITGPLTGLTIVAVALAAVFAFG
jgi:putative membrane protein